MQRSIDKSAFNAIEGLGPTFVSHVTGSIGLYATDLVEVIRVTLLLPDFSR